jgi:Suppressor of fused protein (SUFU)
MASAEEPDFVEQRELAYERLMGREYEFVYHDSEPTVPHVDVYVFAPTDDEEYFTLITGGMSDLRMRVPDDLESETRRAELVMFVDEPNEVLANVMRGLAHYPHDNKTWFDFGHTIPWKEPLVPGSKLNTIFLANTEVGGGEVGDDLVIDGDRVKLFQVAGITSVECEFKLREGAKALIDRFIERGATLIVEPERDSYVADDEIGEPFPFAGYPTLGVISTRDVMNGETPILLVAHDQDGEWKFLPGSGFEPEKGVLLHLAHIVEDHPEIHELRDLPRGWAAERTSENDAWERYPLPEGEESES